MDPVAAPPLFPLFADLRGRRVVVVGGGTVARRKLVPLLAAGARVRLVAPDLPPDLAAHAASGSFEHLPQPFAPHTLDDAWLVLAATSDPEVNRAVAEAAEARRIWVNVVDDVSLSSWQSPARVERGPLQVAISSGGGAPMLARHLREQLEAQLDPSLGELAALLLRERGRILALHPELGDRRRFFDRLLASPVATRLRAGDAAGAARAFGVALSSPREQRGTGRVALVGAGPGDPGLLTLRALRLLNEADVILHDRLVGPGVLDLARRDAEFIEVGKQAANHHVSQDSIHALMLEHARAGRRVVRLKGGDPFVFGRGGEELQFLRAHKIDYEVVPGITAALACAAYSGVPLTHRDHAQSVRLVTAHCAQSLETLDWQVLAQDRQTLAVYMGVAGLDRLRAQLLAHGRQPGTPFALVENGSRPEQRVVTGTLDQLPDLAARFGVQSPALLLLGEVAALAEPLHWFGMPPLQASAKQHPHTAGRAA